MPVAECFLRVACPADADAVTALLAVAYPTLMAPSYDAAILAAALPAMTRANPALLASGSYYVQELPDGRIASCGGWTREKPGTGEVEDGVAHVRHFATHADWCRKGLGKSIFDCCRQSALAAGVHTMMSFASLNAEPFYASLGFVPVQRTSVGMGSGLSFPTVIMAWTAAPA